MSAVERLAKALRGANMQDGPGSEHGAEAMLYADPTLAEDIELGAAWRDAEAALPEGWELETLTTVAGAWWATAVDFDSTRQTAGGPTPAEALRALSAKLHEVKP